MDAPWHYHPTTDHRFKEGGVPSPTIDQVPLEWCFQPGVKLDFRHVPDGTVLKPDDLEAAFAKIGHTPKALEIVLFNTRASAVYGTPAYFEAGCGVGRDATLWLTERGIRVVGTDAFGWDAPFVHVAKRFSETQDPSIIWEGHKAGREIGYYQMEKLHNLEALPPVGFRVACFPIKIKAASAGWVRAVALLED
jgi:kynurenine formamidase